VRLRRFALLAVCTTAASAPATAAPPSIALTPCRPAGVAEDLRCGTLRVPEDRGSRSSRTIALNVVVLPALGSERREPLFELAGGPGVPSTGSVELYATELRAYRHHRDVVLFDQRGTGRSNPLDCPVAGTPFMRALGEMYPPAYVQACRDALEKKADLRFYTTTISAQDLDDVRTALGYERIHLLGISYGTRLAQEYARRHPSRVKSLFLVGALPMWATVPLYHAAGAQRALDQLFDDCAADSSCAARYPGLRGAFRQLLAALRRTPAAVTRGAESARLSADVFTEGLRTMLYTPAGSRAVPKVIHRAAQGDWEPFLEHLVQEGKPGADGMYLSVTCSEDVARIDPRAVRGLTAGTYFGDYRVRQQVRACAAWPRAHVPPDFWDDVQSDLPALLYAGHRDPITPPAWTDAVAAHFTRASVLLIDHEAHMPVGLGGMECWDAMAQRFLDEGALQPADTACVTEMKAPPFE